MNYGGAKFFLEMLLEVPVLARLATEQIQAQPTELRKRVARQVRFGEHDKSGHSSGSRKLVERGFMERMQR